MINFSDQTWGFKYQFMRATDGNIKTKDVAKSQGTVTVSVHYST